MGCSNRKITGSAFAVYLSFSLRHVKNADYLNNSFTVMPTTALISKLTLEQQFG
jgi:hypothetical protein